MDYQVLKDEITNDPLARGYSGMGDVAVAADLNTLYRERDRKIMSGSEIWAQTVSSEYNALSELADNNEKHKWISFCGILEHDPFGNSAQFVIDIFGISSVTVINLAAARVETITRATELGLGVISEGDVEYARAM